MSWHKKWKILSQSYSQNYKINNQALNNFYIISIVASLKQLRNYP